ncbi:MAG TPA: ATP-binding protein [Bryobacterales bacterium]|nr:ATP-binding protein [Bryobacterales bacterium]
MPDNPRAEKLLVVGSDAGLRERARQGADASLFIAEAASAEAARAILEKSFLEQNPPDVVVLDAAAAVQLAPDIAGREDAPPVIVVGAPAEVFACLSSPAELPSAIGAALRYRRLQMENKLIREESERIHAEMLASYGKVWEHSHELEEEVKNRTTELRRYAEDLERQVEERSEALQRSRAQLVEQDKMAALGALVSGIAHDMHTPIGTITSNSDVLVRSLARLREVIASEACPEAFRNNADLKRVLGVIEEISRVNQLACERIIGIVRSLRNFARLDEAEVRSTDLHEGIESTLTLVHHELKNRITVNKEFGDIPRVPCHSNQLNQVFMNMLVNASHAIGGKGAITIRTFRDGDMVKIQIADTGSGIPPENLQRIFDTGFTTKKAGVGTGLGLAICRKIIEDHHGKIEVESEVGRGTTFTISLPVEWKAS